MFGWGGHVLRIDLSKRKFVVQSLNSSLAQNYIGGRGFAIKTLWDELPPGADPLSPLNKLILAVGPLTALPIPNSGKLLVAAKSPLTGGYGDGNIGSWLAIHMRRAGLDMIIIEGKAEEPRTCTSRIRAMNLELILIVRRIYGVLTPSPQRIG